MGQAQIYWDMEQYSKVQSILQQSADFCSEHEAWKLNSAHAHFMQGGMVHTSILCLQDMTVHLGCSSPCPLSIPNHLSRCVKVAGCCSSSSMALYTSQQQIEDFCVA